MVEREPSLGDAEGALSERLNRELRRVWGFEALRPIQHEVVKAAMQDRDAVVVMPTGSGKSLCFQLPAIVRDRLTVVVSPLIALMKDQVDALRTVGVRAAALNSSLSPEEMDQVTAAVRSGGIRLLYVSPERILTSGTLALLREADQGRGVAQFAIDEAHCISAWGHDFRPEYRQLGELKRLFPEVPVQAFTATATPKVQRDIAIQLRMVRPRRFVGGFDRPNLTYRVVAKDDAVGRMVEAVRRYPDEGVIIYCLARKDTERYAAALQAAGIPAVAYHAGLDSTTRRRVSEAFAQERSNVVVATVAFGMGIDRSNVRCVLHECLPKSMEGYQQETGRAGRDGLPAECILLYSYGDVMRLRRLIGEGEPEVVEHHLSLLEEVRRFVIASECRHLALMKYFGEAYEVGDGGCGACDHCLGGSTLVDEGDRKARILLETASELCQGRPFGVTFLASVLTGSENKEVLSRGGDQCRHFGALREDRSRISLWIHQLIDQGLLESSGTAFPTVHISAAGARALQSRDVLELTENAALISTRKAWSAASAAGIEGVDPALFERFRAWRRELAQQRGVPAYVILHDATLMRLAAVRPSTRERLEAIQGFGEARARDFGDDLLKLIQESGLSRDQTLVAQPKPPPTGAAADYFSYFDRGMSIEEVMAARAVVAATAWGRFCEWVDHRRPESVSKWIPDDERRRIEAVIDVFGVEGSAAPLMEALGEGTNYNMLRAIRTLRRNASGAPEVATRVV